jgi:chitinase
MKKFTKPIMAALIAILAITAIVSNIPIRAANYQCGTYFPNWATYNASLQNMSVSMIPWDKVTFVNHAFYKVSSSYTLISTDSWADEQKTFDHSDGWSVSPRIAGHMGEYRYYKTLYPNVKILISIGGWTAGENFHAMAASSSTRATFINSCIEFLKRNTFIDGLDIDWEYPGIDRAADPNDQYDHGCPGGPEDTANFTALLKELREAYNANGLSDKLLTIAGPGGYDKVDLQQPGTYHQYLDWINVMTYDMHGVWETNTNLHAPLYANPSDPSATSPVNVTNYNIDYIMKYYEAKGVPASKLHLGMPFYSRGWKNVGTNGTNGLFATASGAPVGNIDNASAPGGQNTYPAVLLLESASGYVKYRDSVNNQPYLYNTSAGLFYTYDDPTSLTAKCNYVIDHNYGGVFSWDIANDTTDYALQTLLKSLMNRTVSTTSSIVESTSAPTTTTTTAATGTSTATPTSIATSPSTSTGSTWTANTSYHVGDIVAYNGINYQCRQSHTSLSGWEPANVAALWQVSTAAATVNTAGNTTTATPTFASSTWAANTSYQTGDSVTYNGKLYKCRQGHTALTGWEPPVVPALWQAL